VAGNNVVTFIRWATGLCQQLVSTAALENLMLQLRKYPATARPTFTGPLVAAALRNLYDIGMKTFSCDAGRCGAASKV